MLARKNDIVTKHTKGLDFLMKKNKITVINGYRPPHRPREGRRPHHRRQARRRQAARPVKAKKVVLATGSDARMLPGYKPDDTILTNIEILTIAMCPSRWSSSAPARSASSSPPSSRASAPRSPIVEFLPRIVPVEDEDISKELAAPVQEARHRRQRLGARSKDREDQGRA